MRKDHMYGKKKKPEAEDRRREKGGGAGGGGRSKNRHQNGPRTQGRSKKVTEY